MSGSTSDVAPFLSSASRHAAIPCLTRSWTKSSLRSTAPPAAKSVATRQADFGNAEISELFYPIMFLGRNVEPDSGGYGKFRGGLGHTAVWMADGLATLCTWQSVQSAVGTSASSRALAGSVWVPGKAPGP